MIKYTFRVEVKLPASYAMPAEHASSINIAITDFFLDQGKEFDSLSVEWVKLERTDLEET